MKTLLALVVATTMLAVGCGESDPVVVPGATPASIILCKDCGEVKGSEACCAEGAEVCDCGFHHGSPACCKLEKTGEDIVVCGKCGEVEGSDKCCADGAEICMHCDKHKDSPGCCIDKKEDPSQASEQPATDETEGETAE